MLQIQKEHKRSTLMSAKKTDLAEQIMHLEHNNNVLEDTINQQAKNFLVLEKETEIRVLKNYVKYMPKVYSEKNMNYIVVGDILLNGTSTSGQTSCIEKCRKLGLNPFGYKLLESEAE